MSADYTAYKATFHHLANEYDPSIRDIGFARKLWKISMNDDFHPADMEIDQDLIVLGLAKKKKCGCVVYKGMDQSCWRDHGER